MNRPAYPTEDEIHAYVDDALDLGRRAEVAGILRDDAALAARVATFQADRDNLRQALTEALLQPLPAAWLDRIEVATNPRTALSRRWAIGSGLALAAAASVAAVLRWPAGDGILGEALAARDAAQDGPAPADALPPRDGWNAMLASALGLKVRVPDLSAFGFRLARLDLVGSSQPRRGAQLAYRDARARRLTIYVRPSDGRVRFDLLRHGNERVCIWQDDVVSAVIIAPMSAGEMMRVASSAYAALNL